MDWETSSSGPSRSRGSTSGPSFLDRLSAVGGTPAPGSHGPPTSDFDAFSTYAGTEAGDIDRGPEGESPPKTTPRRDVHCWGDRSCCARSLLCFVTLTPVFSQQQLSQPEAEDDLRLLERAWVKERGVAAVLQWEGELVDSVLDKVEQQVG